MKQPAWTARHSGKIIDEHGAEVAHVFMFKNLPLVAAAPALLKALEDCTRELEACARQLQDEGYTIGQTVLRPLAAARAAIAQAGHKPAGDI